jgi:glycosyltransferase involved in cell wall biosynthesis
MRVASNSSALLPTSRPALFCFSHLRWSFVWQRPQHLLSRAAEDYDVFFFEEPMCKAGAVPQLESSVVAPHITVVVPVLPEGPSDGELLALQKRLVEEYVAKVSSPKRVIWYYTPMALAFTREVPRDVTVYDNMDELAAFRGASAELLDLEAQLFAEADVIFTGGRSLYEAKKARHPNVHCFPSSIDAAHFASARLKLEDEPADQQSIPHPRVGFFGVIDERMDMLLLESLAKLRRNWHFIMIGPVAKVRPEELPRAENLHWLGMRSYKELPSYLARWDLGLMPFALNESTRFISPTKTPEFLAAGLPVVSTAVPDVVHAYGDTGLVEIATDAADVVLAIERLLDGRRPGWLAEVDARLATESWDVTWHAMNALVGAAGAHPNQSANVGSRESPLAYSG